MTELKQVRRLISSILSRELLAYQDKHDITIGHAGRDLGMDGSSQFYRMAYEGQVPHSVAGLRLLWRLEEENGTDLLTEIRQKYGRPSYRIPVQKRHEAGEEYAVLGKWLGEVVAYQKVSVIWLGEQLGQSGEIVSGWISGIRRPALGQFIILCSVLNVTGKQLADLKERLGVK